MKRAIVLLLSIMISGAVFSAPNLKGLVEINGGLGMSYTSTDITIGTTTYTYSTFSNEVSATYYFTENIGIGFGGSNTIQTVKVGLDTAKEATNLLGPSLSVALPIDEKLAIKFQGTILFGNGYSESNGVTTGSYNATGYGFNALLSIYENEHISMDPFFGIGSVTYTDNSSSTTLQSNDLMAFGFSVSIYTELFGK